MLLHLNEVFAELNISGLKSHCGGIQKGD